MALGCTVDVAINHNPVALAMHEVNHPETLHLSSDVWEVDPRVVAKGRSVKVAWFSPDCTHFSRAKGGTPVDKGIRSLAWVVVDWIDKVAPEIIAVENVPELLDWGPLIQSCDRDGNPRYQRNGEPYMVADPARRGETFRAWVEKIKGYGYSIGWKVLRAADFGAPTSRQRLFVVARRDGAPIQWPAPTHAPVDSLPVRYGRMKPYVPASSIIDFEQICPSIFMTKEEGKGSGITVRRPLADSTLRRVAAGVWRYVVSAESPSFVERIDTGIAVKGPACVYVIKHFTGITGQDIEKPLSTITAIDHHGLVATRVADPHGDDMTDDDRYRAWWVARFLEEYRGTDSVDPGSMFPVERPSSIEIPDGRIIVDVGMRMLTPAELFRAQGFPDDYVFDRDQLGTPFTKTAQIAACGNSVPPVLAKVVVESQLYSSGHAGMPSASDIPASPT